jgi:hypothetical protein
LAVRGRRRWDGACRRRCQGGVFGNRDVYPVLTG